MGCAPCPYPLLCVPLIFALAALAVTYAATFDCTFFTSSEVPEAVTAEAVTSWEYGLWTSRYFAWWLGSGQHTGVARTCLAYDERLNPVDMDSVRDGPMRAARAFGLMSCLLGTITFLVLLAASCCRFGDDGRKTATAGFFFLCGIMSLLMLIALNSNLCQGASSCTMGRAGVLSIVAAVLWFVTGFCVMFLLKEAAPKEAASSSPTAPPPAAAAAAPPATAAVNANDPTLGPGSTQQKVHEQTVNADGTTTVKTTLTTTNSDGSKTVTETTTVGGV